MVPALVAMMTAMKEQPHRLSRTDEEKLFALFWFSYWMTKLGDPDDVLDDKRESLIRRRYTEANRDGDLMLYVVDGVSRDDFRMGRTGKGDSRELRAVRSILKDFEVMRNLALKGGWKSGKAHPLRAKYATPTHAGG